MLRLCVLIPAKDEELVIGATIASILNAGVSQKDIHLIDDGSSDRTSEIAKEFGVWVMKNKTNIGKARSIERATQYFSLVWQYDLIALMDADTRVESNYFDAIKNRFADDDAAAVVCGKVKSRPHNWITAYRAYVYSITHFIYKNGQNALGVITVVPGCTATYRASIFSELEWSSDTLVEDADVTLQAHVKKLGKIAYEGKAVVHTQDPKTLRDYIKQMRRWYIGAWQVARKHHVFTGIKKIDFECKLLMGEGLFFALIASLIPLWLLLFPRTTVFILLTDFILETVLSIFVGIIERRKDVVLYSPIFPMLRYVDCIILVFSFWSVIVRRKKISSWLFVNRYTETVKEVR